MPRPSDPAQPVGRDGERNTTLVATERALDCTLDNSRGRDHDVLHRVSTIAAFAQPLGAAQRPESHRHNGACRGASESNGNGTGLDVDREITSALGAPPRLELSIAGYGVALRLPLGDEEELCAS